MNSVERHLRGILKRTLLEMISVSEEHLMRSKSSISSGEIGRVDKVSCRCVWSWGEGNSGM